MDPKAAAILILKKRGGGEEGAEPDEPAPSSDGKEALASMFDAFKSGDMDAAYDAFHAAVQACMNEEQSEGEGY